MKTPIEQGEQADLDSEEELSRASATLANGLGRCLDEIAVPDGSSRLTGVAEGLLASIESLRSTHTLVDSLDAARASSLTRAQGFASGTVHAFGAILEAYQARMAELDQPGVAQEAGEPTDRVCSQMGRRLADLQFTEGWKVVHSTRGTSSDEVFDGARGYVDGREYALKRAVTSLRSRIEDRVQRVLASDDSADSRDRLASLLFIAVTDASAARVCSIVGPTAGDALDRLDEDDHIRCLEDRPNTPLGVTSTGAAEAYRLAREFEANDLVAAEGA